VSALRAEYLHKRHPSANKSNKKKKKGVIGLEIELGRQ
jgi:hypothetical protein